MVEPISKPRVAGKNPSTKRFNGKFGINQMYFWTINRNLVKTGSL